MAPEVADVDRINQVAAVIDAALDRPAHRKPEKPEGRGGRPPGEALEQTDAATEASAPEAAALEMDNRQQIRLGRSPCPDADGH